MTDEAVLLEVYRWDGIRSRLLAGDAGLRWDGEAPHPAELALLAATASAVAEAQRGAAP